MARKPVQAPEMPVSGPSVPEQTPVIPSQTGEPEPPEPTLGDLLGLQKLENADIPRAGVMSDDPYEVPTGFSPIPGFTPAGMPDPGLTPLPSAHAAPLPEHPQLAIRSPVEPEFFPPSSAQRWETRIEVVEAFQYRGTVIGAPDWIDRSWIGYADLDPVRGIPPGPCLRVPLVGPQGGDDGNVVVRVGDYVVRQAVKFPDRPPILKVEVWAREAFENYFMPATSSPPPTGLRDEGPSRAVAEAA